MSELTPETLPVPPDSGPPGNGGAPEIENRHTNTRRLIPQLDGFRALAIVLVLMNHMVDLQTPAVVSYICYLGWIGVDVFFVLSGFLITKILLGSKREFRSIGLFVVRRTLRTWPLYFVVLFIAYIALRHDPAGQATNWLQHIFFLQNFTPWYIARSLGPTWSLCIEEHFYFVWPFLVFLLPRRWLYVLLPAIFLALPAVRYWGIHDGFTSKQIYTETQFHLDGLIAGSFVALLAARFGHCSRRSLWIACSGLALGSLASIAGFWNNWNVIYGHNAVFGFTTLSIAFASLLHLLLRSESSWLAKIFCAAPLRYIGRISYGIYLLQDGMISLLNRVPLQRLPGGVASNWLFVMLLRAGVTVAVAAVSFRFFESPILRFKDRLR
jgi:peptidoglycan/LPS O-acetylase OafA/YrhL